MIDLALIDYATCQKYAAERCFKLHVPKGDWADVGSDAYLLSIRRAWRSTADVNPESFARRLMFTAVIDTIKSRGYRKNLVYIDSIPVVEPDRDETNEDDEVVESGLVISDNGEAAKRIVSFDEDWQHPFWLRLFNHERKQLRRERSKSPLADLTLKVIKAGLKDSRLWLIKDSLKISGNRYCAILNFFKMRFALCFQALREYRGQDECPTFWCDTRPYA